MVTGARASQVTSLPMKVLKTLVASAAVLTCCLGNPVPAEASGFCEEIRGASVVASDGTYLGKIDSSYDSESIFNDYGTYGNKYNSASIWNEYGTYGGK